MGCMVNYLCHEGIKRESDVAAENLDEDPDKKKIAIIDLLEKLKQLGWPV